MTRRSVRPLRVGLAVPGLGFVGGIERHAHDLARGLAARGHEVTLLHGSATGRDPDDYARPFARVLPVEEAPGVCDALDVVYVQRAADVADLRPFTGAPVLVATHDHDLTCVRSHRYLPVSLAPCHRAPGLACVTHGCIVVRDRRPSARLPVTLHSPFALRARLRRLALRAPMVACSRYVADHVVAAGVDPRRVHVVHPIPPEDDRPIVPRPTARRLLVVGQLLRGKGFDIAVRALARLPADVTLTVAGDGPSRDSLEALASRVAPGRVRFTGWLSPDALGGLYDEARVVVVPSRWPEPFGMVGIEAMRRARPVVGADHGGIPEWLAPGRGGSRFTPGDDESLARAAGALLDDEEAGARALTEARERFPHARLLDGIETLLARLAPKADGSPC